MYYNLEMNEDLLTSTITFRLSFYEKEKLRRIAKSKGLGMSALVRMWILERLAEEQKKKK